MSITLLLHHYWLTFAQLIRVPFEHLALVWGIVPLYFGWVVNEMTSSKRSFATALQTGFSFLWAGLHWAYLDYHRGAGSFRLVSVNAFVTALVITTGIIALLSGFRKSYPKYCAFLGHTRFSNYFMIAIFPMQANFLHWNWNRLGAILLFAAPIWAVVYFAFKPLRD